MRCPLTKVPLRAVQIGDGVVVADAADFGVMARDLRVVDLNRAGGVAAQADARLGQFETAALVGSADDEQRRHGPDSRVVPSNSSILRIKGP